MKLQQDGRTSAPDLIEVSSGMYDLARWAKQDIAAHKSTEEPLTDDRMKWYRGRMNGVMDAVQKSYPKAVKTWRATTQPEDQAQELDYFNVSTHLYRFLLLALLEKLTLLHFRTDSGIHQQLSRPISTQTEFSRSIP